MDKMKLRKLKESGIRKMGEYLDSLSAEHPLGYPYGILADPLFSDAVSDVEVEPMDFDNKHAVASYLYNIFTKAGLTDVATDSGLWCWLSLYYFEQLCPRDRGGKFNPGARARWIPEVHNFQRYYRHLLAGPYRIFYFHRDKPDRAKALLCGEICKQGDLIEQLASRQELITNRHLIEAVTHLYYDPETGKNKRGAGGKGGGSPRRLAEVIDQFNLTWDLYSTTSDEIMYLLPAEFERFKKGNQ